MNGTYDDLKLAQIREIELAAFAYQQQPTIEHERALQAASSGLESMMGTQTNSRLGA